MCPGSCHSMWFHRPTRVYERLPVDLCLHQFIGTGGPAVGDVFTRSGELMATVVQQGLVRVRT